MNQQWFSERDWKTLENITYEYFCVLGGLANPRCRKKHHSSGSYHYCTYWAWMR